MKKTKMTTADREAIRVAIERDTAWQRVKEFYNVVDGMAHVHGVFETREEAERFMREKLIPDHDCLIVVSDEPIIG